MNDDNKNLGQNTPPVAQSDQPQVQVQPTVPTGSLNKETGPVGAPASEFVKLSEAEPQIDKDLKELGVEAEREEPAIEEEHKRVIDHAKEFTPVLSAPSGKIVMPMTEEEVVIQLKTGQDDDSKKWLAELLKKITTMMGL